MNKETKVGLLVGLSFIVLFGVILSGRAPDVPVTPERTMVSQAPHKRTDNVQVVRRIDLPEELPAAPGLNQVDATKPNADDGTAAAPEKPAPVDKPIAPAPDQPVANNSQQPAAPSQDMTAEAPAAPAHRADAEIIDPPPADDQHLADAEPNGDEVQSPAKAAHDDAKMVEYTIKKGDTLSKIARTLCGNDSLKTINMIYDANRDKMPSKSACVIGRTLQIPVVKKDKNTEALLKSGQFEEVAHARPDESDMADEDSSGTTESAKTTEVTKPASDPAPKDTRTTPKSSIKTLPNDALARYIEQETEDADMESLASTPKEGNKSPFSLEDSQGQPKGALAAAIEQVTQEVTNSTSSVDDTTTPVDARPSTVALSVQKSNLRRYQVQKGDTWYKLAAKFMGDARRWKELYALNDDIFPDATKLRTGVKIRVPERME